MFVYFAGTTGPGPAPAPDPTRAGARGAQELDRDFRTLYSTTGRPSIPPEQLLSALLLQVFYGVRSERQLMEQLDYNLLYRWFVGLSPDDAVGDATTFTKNRERLQHGDLFNRFMDALLHHKEVTPLLSDEQFSVDGTLIEAWAGQKSFKPQDETDSDGEHFPGTRRKNATHASTTDPDSRLYRKSEGQTTSYAVRLDKIINRGDLSTNFTVAPGDVITVPERAF